MILIHRYSDQDKEIWNKFNKEAKNSLFMFDRNYMDYHKDRFQDHSLMFYRNGKLIALLPMNEKRKELISHGGLTYGGFISDSKMKQHIMNDCFEALIRYAIENKFSHLKYKCIPYIYHEQPAQEDRYSLFLHNAQLVTVDASTYLNLKYPIKMSKGRKAQISRARREGVSVEILTEAVDYQKFIDIENEVLGERHGTQAVHTSSELKMLHDNFPDSIHLFGALKGETMIAGTVVYEYEQAVHTQYMAANSEARQIGALDLIINDVIEKYKETKCWLDFGISTEHNSLYLNEGLIFQKEGFGGRTGVYETWEYNF